MTERGLQPERTDLAWTRTAAAVIVAGAIQLRKAAESGGGLAFVPGFLFVATGLLFLALSRRRSSAGRRGRTGTNRRAYALALASVVFGLSSMGLIVVSAS